MGNEPIKMQCSKDMRTERTTKDAETEFYAGLIELGYGQDVQEKLCHIARKIPWAYGWPEDARAFWNAESFMWEYKISGETRKAIAEELSSLAFPGSRNLDLGCGAYSYIHSIGFDIAEKMLILNEQCKEKIVGDLEQPLPFADSSFDFVTAVFALNYVARHTQLVGEICRVLRNDGLFVMVLSSGMVNDWQRQQEQHDLSAGGWTTILQRYFSVQSYRKKGLLFWKCRKRV